MKVIVNINKKNYNFNENMQEELVKTFTSFYKPVELNNTKGFTLEYIKRLDNFNILLTFTNNCFTIIKLSPTYKIENPISEQAINYFALNLLDFLTEKNLLLENDLLEVISRFEIKRNPRKNK